MFVTTEATPLNVEALLDPGAYDHEVEDIHLVETHISWVVLTGPFAYKIKKALNLGFLDFSTLDKRRFFCEEEIRLNRRLAPQVYLDVVPITGSPHTPTFKGEGPAIEYAVRMRQFLQDGLLDRLIARGALQTKHIDAITAVVARFHGEIPHAPPETPFGSPDRALAPVAENFRQILDLDHEPADRTRLETLRYWIHGLHGRLANTMARRKFEGRVRECHGDMHLGNMALEDDEILIFDGIEFSDDLRWIDVMNEVAFLVSDLEHRGRPDYAWRFLNGYLEITGDYAGLTVLRYYQAYRAMVRAKVTRIRLSQADVPESDKPAAEAEFRRYLAQVENYARPGRPTLVIMHGPSGSGKTVISQGLLERWGAIRIRSDVERKRLFLLAATESSHSAITGGIYTPEATYKTYNRLVHLARQILRAGYPTIVDASFLQREPRHLFRDLAGELKIPIVILDVYADESILRRRVEKRAAAGADASEADVSVLAQQLLDYGPLDVDEQSLALQIDGGSDVDYEELLGAIQTQPAG